MGTIELDAKVKELRELRRMAEELAAEIDGLTDTIKAEMTARGVDELSGTDWKATFKAVTSSRLDTAALKKALDYTMSNVSPAAVCGWLCWELR